jgi:hypothetical protein
MQVKDYIPTTAGLELGDEGTDVERLQAYLRKYGYIDSQVLDTYGSREVSIAEEPPAPGVFDDNTKRAVERFQEFAGIPVTGQLDQATLTMMERPRCGFPDTANFVIDGRKWDHTDIKYSFRELSSDLPAGQLRQAIKDAFGLWDAASGLTFQEVGPQDNVDIVIRFVPGDHGDGDGFDGPGHILAHAFFPPPNAGQLAGDAHFDEDERWSLDIPASGTDLITVAAHEFGHSLGLAHSQVQDALMFPFYDGPNRKLHEDDKAGIRQLYGEGSNLSGGTSQTNGAVAFGAFEKGELDRLLSGYPCIVQIHNQTPPEWQASLVGAATKFFYQNPDGSPEGEPYTDTDLNVNIPSGGSLANRSDFPDRCVRRADTIIWVKVPDQPPAQFGQSEEVQPGVCLRSKEYILAPKENLEVGKLGSRNLTDLFELVLRR